MNSCLVANVSVSDTHTHTLFSTHPTILESVLGVPEEQQRRDILIRLAITHINYPVGKGTYFV